MTKDFKNNLILLLIASIFAVFGWSASVFVDGNLFKDFCEHGYCVKPIVLSLDGVLLLFLCFVFLVLLW